MLRTSGGIKLTDTSVLSSTMLFWTQLDNFVGGSGATYFTSCLTWGSSSLVTLMAGVVLVLRISSVSVSVSSGAAVQKGHAKLLFLPCAC